MHPYYLPYLAYLLLPDVAQRQLLQRGGRAAALTLAVSRLTDISVIDELTEHEDPQVRRLAYRRTSRVDLVNAALSGEHFVSGAPHAARNVLADPDLLTENLTAADRALALACYCNENTPLAARMRMTPSRADELSEVGSNNAAKLVRSHALVDANRWMLADAGTYGPFVRRALAALPELTREQGDAIRAAGRAGATTLSRHPLYSGFDPYRSDVHSSIAMVSPTVDLILSGLDYLTEEQAASLLSRRVEPEPYVIARIVARFGPFIGGLTDSSVVQRWSDTRAEAAEWLEEPVAAMRLVYMQARDQMTEAVEILGTDAAAWSNFLSLLPGWSAGYSDAARAATKL
jgi:hypothetical protein